MGIGYICSGLMMASDWVKISWQVASHQKHHSDSFYERNGALQDCAEGLQVVQWLGSRTTCGKSKELAFGQAGGEGEKLEKGKSSRWEERWSEWE